MTGRQVAESGELKLLPLEGGQTNIVLTYEGCRVMIRYVGLILG